MKNREDIVKAGLDKKIYKHIELLDESGIIEDLSGLKTNELAQIFDKEDTTDIDSTIELISNDEISLDMDVNDTDLIDEYNEYIAAKNVEDVVDEGLANSELEEIKEELETIEEELTEEIVGQINNDIDAFEVEKEENSNLDATIIEEDNNEIEVVEIEEKPLVSEDDVDESKYKKNTEDKGNEEYSTSEFIEKTIEESLHEEEETKQKEIEKLKEEAKEAEAAIDPQELKDLEKLKNEDIDMDAINEEDEKPDYVFIGLVFIVIIAVIALIYLFLTGGI